MKHVLLIVLFIFGSLALWRDIEATRLEAPKIAYPLDLSKGAWVWRCLWINGEGPIKIIQPNYTQPACLTPPNPEEVKRYENELKKWDADEKLGADLSKLK